MVLYENSIQDGGQPLWEKAKEMALESMNDTATFQRQLVHVLGPILTLEEAEVSHYMQNVYHMQQHLGLALQV